MSHGYWIEDIGGVFDGLAIIFSDAPVGNTSVKVTNSNFHHNMFGGNFDSFRIGCLVTTIFDVEGTLHEPWDILSISHSLINDSFFDFYAKNDFNSHITLNEYNHSIIHIITSTNPSVNLRIHLDHLKYEQIYVGIRNPFILSESKGHKNLEIILDSLNLYGNFSTSFKTTLNSGKMVFVNTKSVYINGENNTFKQLTSSVIQSYNSDIHLNGTLIFYNNKASYGAAI